MKILAPVRTMPDPTRPIRVDKTGTVDIMRWIANPIDEHAVDRAVAMHVDEIVAVATRDDILLSALARGANRGILVDTVDDRAFAAALVDIARAENPDLILLGDGEAGPRLAGALGLPQATGVDGLDFIDGGVRVSCKLPRYREVIELTLPAVIALHPSAGIPKLISLHAIVDAREKRVDHHKQAAVTSGYHVTKSEAAPKSRLGKMVGSVDELVHALREEARVI